MKTLENNKWVVALICGGLIAIAGMVAAFGSVVFAAPAIRDENNIPAVFGSSCASSSSSVVLVGASNSRQIVATSTDGRRANVVIQQATTVDTGIATSSIFVTMQNDAPASLNSGFRISTTSSPFEVGLNTSYPYTGAITAIGTNGSTTLLVSVCTY